MTFNSATGVLEGVTSDPVSSLALTLTASNSIGTSNSNFNLEIESNLSTPSISAGYVVETFGRGARIIGSLTDFGGTGNEVTIYYGLSDEGQSPSTWSASKALGVINQGEFEVHLDGLDSGKTYFYRFLADNSLTAWSNVGTFTTDSFDQGILRIHSGSDEFGMNAGIFWDRNNGDGEQKMYGASVSTFSYQAPDGSAWKVSKASFTIE